MNAIKCVAYIALLTVDEIKFKFKHFIEMDKFQKMVEEEQEKRHRELEAYMKRYIALTEKARSEKE